MLDTARKEDPNGHYGRRGAKEYKELGYLSTDYHESVSHTIDFSYSDFCIAQTAQLLGKEELAKEYTQSSFSYRTLFDPETGISGQKIRRDISDQTSRPSVGDATMQSALPFRQP